MNAHARANRGGDAADVGVVGEVDDLPVHAHAGERRPPSLVATTLLSEGVGNPLVLVYEIDKPPHTAHVGDPYRPLYALLEPTCSRRFVDEHLRLPIDASAVS